MMYTDSVTNMMTRSGSQWPPYNSELCQIDGNTSILKPRTSQVRVSMPRGDHCLKSDSLTYYGKAKNTEKLCRWQEVPHRDFCVDWRAFRTHMSFAVDKIKFEKKNHPRGVYTAASLRVYTIVTSGRCLVEPDNRPYTATTTRRI